MRKREKRFVISFHTTADAMAAEKGCKEHGIEGRLIPVPRQISAGCGIAWSSPLEEKQRLPIVMEQLGIEPEDMVECEI